MSDQSTIIPSADPVPEEEPAQQEPQLQEELQLQLQLQQEEDPSTSSSSDAVIITLEELQACLSTLQRLVHQQDRRGLELLSEEQRIALMQAAGRLSRPSKEDLTKRKKQAKDLAASQKRALEKRARETTGIRVARQAEIFQAPEQQPQQQQHQHQYVSSSSSPSFLILEEVEEEEGEQKQQQQQQQQQQVVVGALLPELKSFRNCYVCKAKFTQLHPFYDTMCMRCGDFNYQKRFQTADMTGQVALLTGSRLKIGYHCALRMLRAGAVVIATTRFPVDAAMRFHQQEADYDTWKDRLHIHGLDLRHTPSVELFCTYIEQTYDRLDILINNAAQTVRRPPGFYAHLLEAEQMPMEDHAPAVQHLLKSHYTLLQRIGGAGGGGGVGGANNHNVVVSGAVSSSSSSDDDDDDDHHHYQQSSSLMARTTTTTTTTTTQARTSHGPSVTWDTTSPGIGLRASAQLSQIPYKYDGSDHELQQQQLQQQHPEQNLSNNQALIFPKGKLDADLQQVDLRTTNSWRLTLGEVSTMELLEVQLVNAIAPFVLCNRLVPMMKRPNTLTGQKHIVNVTAMEGKFYTFHKPTDRHPHTNMAKAALNMLTHTSATELAKHGIYMNAVDTGWVTDEDPAHLAAKKVNVHDFQPPLDIVDGAARVCDPFFDGINRGEHWCGKFLKDYFPIPW